MINKKGQLLSPFTTIGSIIGILALIIIFLALVNLFPEPATKVYVNEVKSYGDIFITNYLRYDNLEYEGQKITMSDAIILYHASEYKNVILENLIKTNTKQIINGLFNENSCFNIRIDHVTRIESDSDCKDNKINSEAKIPYANKYLLITIEGES